jgi:D-alanyl-lipoteichoic acid acyltransferase DltB (MBOAT superfamily)
MLFSSYGFIFVFLPAAFLAFLVANRWAGANWAIGMIVAASLLFYAAWEPWFLVLLLPSILGNWLLGLALARSGRFARPLLAAGVTVNLGLLGWFKYAGFLAASANGLFGLHLGVAAVVLPLGISFFTFEQIGYLVDVRRGLAPERQLLRYAMFVAFFPRLVAGPVLRYVEVMPQVPLRGRIPLRLDDVAVGLTLFSIGLAKKTLLADGISPYASAMFNQAAHGPVDLLTAWGGVLAYTMQIYFDFSGYSDMAIGSARLFGIRFPMNFNSPYQATSIVAFWRRWHISLSRFLRDYLYVALGGNRRGRARRYMNLMATMLLGGLWHGANWTFVVWGALHGAYLIINHAFVALCGRWAWLGAGMRTRPGRVFAWALTILAVMVGWVFFRAPDFAVAATVLAGMAGLHGVSIPQALTDAVPALRPVLAALHIGISSDSGSRFVLTWAWGLPLLAIAALLPNAAMLLRRFDPVLGEVTERPPLLARLCWRPSRTWAVAGAIAAAAGILCLMRGGEFLYWQF